MKANGSRKLAFSGWLALVWIAPVGVVSAQSPADPNEGLQLAVNPASGVYTYSWWGVAGRTYFLQQSGDLLNWTYLQNIQSGAGQPIQVSLAFSDPKRFLRLKYTDVPTGDPYNDDFNGDGLSNWQNLLQGTDPLGPVLLDTNGLPLNWERFYGVPLGTDPDAPAPRGGGLTYLQTFQQKISPSDFYNGSLPGLALAGGADQRGDPGTVLPAPVAVLVTADQRGQGAGLLDAPVTFTVSGGGALLADAADDTNPAPSASVQARTSAQWVNRTLRNVAQVYVYLPATANDASVITASATTGGLTASVTTTAVCDDPTLPPPSSLKVTSASPTGAQLAWTPGDPARATTVQISLDGGATWRTLGTVAAGVQKVTVAGLPVHTSAAFRLLTAPDGAGAPADSGGDGATATLTLPANPASLPAAGGAGSAASPVATVQTLYAVMVNSEETRPAQRGWPLGNYGFLSQGYRDDNYLTFTYTYKETHTNPTLNKVTQYIPRNADYGESDTVIHDLAKAGGLSGTQTLNPQPPGGYGNYDLRPNGSGLYSLFIARPPFESYLLSSFRPAVDSTSLTNDQFTIDISYHVDDLLDTYNNSLGPDDATISVKRTAANPMKFSDLMALTEGDVSLSAGPLPGTPFPVANFYGRSVAGATRVAGFVLQNRNGGPLLLGSIFSLGRFQWQVNGTNNQTVYWDERFTPFVDTPTPVLHPPTAPAEHDIHTWESQGAAQSPIYILDPRARNGGRYGGYDVIPLDLELVPDYDHNHVIDDSDRGKATAEHPFRFWINDDHDNGDTGGDDIPSGTGPGTGRDCDNDRITSTRDLVDWFPVYLKITSLVSQLSPDDYTYKLSQADAAVNYVITNLTPDHARDYLTDINVARDLTIAPSAEGGSNGPYQNRVYPASADGSALPKAFLTDIRDHGKGVILAEGAGDGRRSASPLVLTVYKNTAPATAVFSLKLPLSISPVEQMFRHKNLRSLAGGNQAVEDRLGEPSNLPDKETNGKSFVFLHGYNVNEQAARGWHAEMFKRLFWSGSKAQFSGVTWLGDETQLLTSFGYKTPNYHFNVENAFASSHGLADFLATLPGEVIVAAHSLDNLVVLSAISDWNATPKQFDMIDAAATIEALYGAANTDPDMVPPPWADGYKFQLRACEWWRLFASSDARSTLTWRNRLANIPATALYNFYSDSEEVLATHPAALIPSVGQTISGYGKYAWVLQEKLKGKMEPPDGYNDLLNASSILASTPSYYGPVSGSTYGGWGFNSYYSNAFGYDSWDTSKPPLLPAAAGALSDDVLRGTVGVPAQPFFNRYYATPVAIALSTTLQFTPAWLPDLFDSATGSATANAHRDQLLAEMIPARTLPIGANVLPSIKPDYNLDMPIAFKTDKFAWKSVQKSDEWHHGDVKKFAYLYLYKLFNSIVTLGNLSD